MIHLLKQINNLLDAKERRSALKVFLLTIITAFLEIAGIASVMPFMAVLATPEMVETNKYLNLGYEFFQFGNTTDYLFFFGLCVLILLVLSNSMIAYTQWVTLHFGTMTGHSISSRLFSNYLNQPYSFFLQKNTSYLSKTVLTEVHALVTNVIIPFAIVFSRGLTSLVILIFLTLINPGLALSAGLILAGSFGLIYLMMRKWLLKIGEKRVQAQTDRYKIIDEAFSGIKNIKLTGHENTYADLYNKPSLMFSHTTARSLVAGEIPKYALEVIGFGGVLFIVLYFLWEGRNVSEILPLLTLYAFAGYRLLPNLQAIFRGYTKIRFHTGLLAEINKNIDETKILLISPPEKRLSFSNKIKFQNVNFNYEGNSKKVLKDFNMIIDKGSRFGLVGKSGAGKTTLVDLMLGLLLPIEGDILIDGIPLTEKNRRAWQQNCAYVTQHIYLTDDTLRANVAFGLPVQDIDDEKVKKACKMAELSDFIEQELPDGYNTSIGENGLRISGGQRQRIGLARALYLDRSVLVLDEATSALDEDTEKLILANISEMGGDKTIIMITHRMESLNTVDNLIKL